MEGFDPKQDSQGLGDTIAKITNFFGIDKVADAVAKLAGAEGCGCNERRQLLNELFPYDTTVRKFLVVRNFSWEGKTYNEGDIIEVNKNHPVQKGVLALAKDNIIQEII